MNRIPKAFDRLRPGVFERIVNARHLPQSQIAKRVGVSQSTVSRALAQHRASEQAQALQAPRFEPATSDDLSGRSYTLAPSRRSA